MALVVPAVISLCRGMPACFPFREMLADAHDIFERLRAEDERVIEGRFLLLQTCVVLRQLMGIVIRELPPPVLRPRLPTGGILPPPRKPR